MGMTAKKKLTTILYHLLVGSFSLIMIYPLAWMVMSSFKESSTIFTTATQLVPSTFTLDNYVNGWKGLEHWLPLPLLPMHSHDVIFQEKTCFFLQCWLP